MSPRSPRFRRRLPLSPSRQSPRGRRRRRSRARCRPSCAGSAARPAISTTNGMPPRARRCRCSTRTPAPNSTSSSQASMRWMRSHEAGPGMPARMRSRFPRQRRQMREDHLRCRPGAGLQRQLPAKPSAPERGRPAANARFAAEQMLRLQWYIVLRVDSRAGARLSRWPLERDPEKCVAVFRKDHAQTNG